ncbi:hypothetical protein KIW84_065417 [Lathyrus oleraceus]|uniref:Uncharacterized protein n=1 Tax=Pisum sativum TaxID=3888 RepID=A0A9D5AAC6_PEA|nr:hypothetical protein KIW84_065417 [Pisum sativum]
MKDFDPIPMTYTQILPYLLQRGLVETRPLAPPSTPPPRGYDANAICDFHACSLGNTTYRCLALKFKVHDLLDRKVISFTTKNSNVKNNPMPRHDGPNINVLHDDCKICRSDPNKCKKMKRCLQQMMTSGLVQTGYSKKIGDVSTIESQRAHNLRYSLPERRNACVISDSCAHVSSDADPDTSSYVILDIGSDVSKVRRPYCLPCFGTIPVYKY